MLPGAPYCGFVGFHFLKTEGVVSIGKSGHVAVPPFRVGHQLPRRSLRPPLQTKQVPFRVPPAPSFLCYLSGSWGLSWLSRHAWRSPFRTQTCCLSPLCLTLFF